MKITLILPALGLHQLSFSNELYNLLGDNFHFIATEKIENGRFGINYDKLSDKYSFVIKAYESNEKFETAKKIINLSDFIIIGSSADIYTELVNNSKSAVIFRYSERFFKKGTWRRFIPKIKIKIKKQFLVNNKKVVALCSSAYLPKDIRYFSEDIITYRWGYFPEFVLHDIDELMKNKSDRVNILWAGRFIHLKHPCDALKAVEKLKVEGLDFHLTFIGEGEEENKISKLVNKYNLNEYVTIKKAMETALLWKEMEKANVFLFTSDFREGWGAVLNEAMNAGCACITSHAPGSVPFIINDNINGLIYHNGNINELYSKIKYLIERKEICEKLGRNAYFTIINKWNYKVAAERLVLLCKKYLSNGEFIEFQDGPLSISDVINNNWYN